MAFDGYFELGGREIVNAARTEAYVANADCPMPVEACVDCGDLREVLGDDPYVSPSVDEAPWYDPSQPETGQFFGFYPLEIEGISDSTREADTTENVNAGGTIGQERFASRSIRFRGVLIALNQHALEAGHAWLRATLSRNQCNSHAGNCGGASLCYYNACPDVADPEPYERQFHGVAAVSGPLTVSNYPIKEVALREVSFILQAGNPFPFGSPVTALPLTPMTSLVTTPWSFSPCQPEGFTPIYDPSCPPLPSPPSPPSIPDACSSSDELPNIFANPSVETNLDDITPWATSGSYTLTREVDPTFAWVGDAYAKLTFDVPAGVPSGQIMNLVTVESGTKYDFRMHVRVDGADQQVNFKVQFYSIEGFALSSYTTAPTTVTSADWTELALTSPQNAPFSAAYAEISAYVSGTGRVWLPGEAMYADGWSDGPFFPPWYRYWLELPATTSPVWGAAMPTMRLKSDESSYREVRVKVFPNPLNADVADAARYTNSVKNPRLGGGRWYWDRVNMGNYNHITTGGPEGDGDDYSRVQASGATPATSLGVAYNRHPAGIISDGTGAIVPGKQYRVSAYVRTNVARSIQLSVGWAKEDKTFISQVDSSAFASPNNVWTRYNFLVTAPAEAAQTYVMATGAGASAWSAGQNIEMTRILFDSNTTLVDYWDGSTPDDATWDYMWEDVSHRSVSARQNEILDPCSFCAEFVVSYMPPNTTLVVDSLTQRAYAEMEDGSTVPVDNLMYDSNGGPMTWPELACGIPYIMTVDMPEPVLDRVEVGLDFTLREEA